MKKRVIKKYHLKENVKDEIIDILGFIFILLFIYFLLVLNSIIF